LLIKRPASLTPILRIVGPIIWAMVGLLLVLPIGEARVIPLLVGFGLAVLVHVATMASTSAQVDAMHQTVQLLADHNERLAEEVDGLRTRVGRHIALCEDTSWRPDPDVWPSATLGSRSA